MPAKKRRDARTPPERSRHSLEHKEEQKRAGDMQEDIGQVMAGRTTSIEGTGLGLPLCQRFAQALGGVLTVESEVAKGTTVTLRLPARVCALQVAPETVAA